MKSDNVLRWARELQTTKEKQGMGALHASNGEHTFCCLGIGAELAQVPSRRHPSSVTQEGVDRFVHKYGMFHTAGLAPVEFVQWLGFKVSAEQAIEGLPLYLDTEKEDRMFRMRGPRYGLLGRVPLHAMNDDWRLPFNQIGDLIAYFGVRV